MIHIQKFNVLQCAVELTQHLKKNVEESGKASLAIPGGRSPGPILKAMAEACQTEIVKDLYLYWVDERCVPIAHPDRNDKGMLAFWKEGGELPKHIRSMPAENDNLDEACKTYSQTIEDDGFSNGLNIVLLGIGEDGHFASLFPNHAGLEEDAITFKIENSPKPPKKRLSLSLPFIKKSSKIVVLIMGQAKGEMLKKAVAEPGPLYPVSLLFSCDNASFYFDEAAEEAYLA